MDATVSSPSSKRGWVGEPAAPLTGARIFLLGALVLGVWSAPQVFDRARNESGAIISTAWALILAAFAVFLALNLLALALTFTPARGRVERATSHAFGWAQSLGWLNLLAVALLFAGFVGYLYLGYTRVFAGFVPRVWAFWLFAGIGAFFLAALWKRPAFFTALLALLVAYGFGVMALGYVPDVTSFPFSLGWSEASRYYYASLPYAKGLFGMEIPLSPWHPSRYLLQGIPFWLADPTLLISRLWQVLLWLILPVLTGLALSRRFRVGRGAALLGALWSALFLLQGPVYYHLLVCVILVLWGFDSRRFWKSMIFIGLGSLWAGISRVNWIPVPAFLAVAMYVMERPVCEFGDVRRVRTWLNYLTMPFAWGVAGCALALLANQAYVSFSGHEDTSSFGSSFTSALLWYRLLPSPTYPLGVLPTILLVTAPQIILLGAVAVRKGREWHFLRPLSLGFMLLVLFVGGLIVSSKIGGGSNIHNMDAYLVLILLIAAYAWMDRIAPEHPTSARPFAGPRLRELLLLLIVLVPVIFNMQIGNPFDRRDMAQADFDLNKLNGIVQQYAAQGEVLFITQRQLIVFDLVPGVKMVPEYELLTLSEMAISGNTAYLERFYADLRNHRFAMIVVDPQNGEIQDPERNDFAEENNAWVEHISRPLMRYYQTELNFDTQGIDLLVPRQ